jgi:hypothetical protein
MEADDAVVVDGIVQDSLERNDLVILFASVIRTGRFTTSSIVVGIRTWTPTAKSFLRHADHSFVEVGEADNRLPSACRLQWAALWVLQFLYNAFFFIIHRFMVDHPTLDLHLVVRDDLSLFFDPKISLNDMT